MKCAIQLSAKIEITGASGDPFKHVASSDGSLTIPQSIDLMSIMKYQVHITLVSSCILLDCDYLLIGLDYGSS